MYVMCAWGDRMPADKLMHLIAGLAIAGVAFDLFGMVGSLISVAAAAASKEIYDSYRHGKPDLWDAIATLAGGSIIWGAVWIA